MDMKKLVNSPNTDFLMRNVKSDHFLSSDVCPIIKTDTGQKLLNNVSGDSLKNARRDYCVENIEKENDERSVPDLVRIMPAQLSSNTVTKASNTSRK